MRTLYLSALPFRSDEKSIRDLVNPYGPIGRIELHADWENPTFEPYALVELEKIGEAVENLDGMKIGSMHLRAHERPGQ
jgi:hypothetical protein